MRDSLAIWAIHFSCMKRELLMVLLALCFSSGALARVGETQAEIAARYGDGQKSESTRLPGTEQTNYTKDGFFFEVMIANGKSVMEVIHRNATAITDDDIKDLMKANGDGHGWGLDRRANEWIRSDHKVKAFRQPGHPDYVFVQDITAVKDLDKKPKGF